MKSKLIRVLIVLCFIGMVVFGVIVFVGNHNVEKKVYTEVTELKNEIKFSNLYSRAESVQAEYRGGQCQYAAYINDAMQTLNEGIDYYLYYMQDMSGMNKKEKDRLIKKYNEYADAINKAKSVLSKYEYYEGNATGTTAKQVSIHAGWFDIEYLKAFREGYEFFIDLQDIVNEKVFEGKMFKNLEQIKYEACTTFAYKSVDALLIQLEVKKGGSAIPHSAPQNADKNAKNFVLFNNYSKVNPGCEYRDKNHAEFVVNYNALSKPRKLLESYSNYANENEKEETIALKVQSFFSSSYGVAI